MQYPNDDMDELFRRAADAYPLNTSSANWEKVHALLAEDEKKEVLPQKDRLRWLWILLPFLVVGLRLNDIRSTGQQQVANQKDFPTMEVPVHPTNSNTGTTQPVAATERSRPTSENPVQGRQPAAFWRSQSFGLTTAYRDPLPAREVNTPAETPFSLMPLLPEDDVPIQDPSTTQAGINSIKPTGINENVPAAEERSLSDKFSTDSLQAVPTVKDTQKPASSGLRKRGFYAGVMAGPDLSTVKFQQFSNVGFQAGVLLGYAFNDRLALEASAFSARKYYSSTGQYYKPEYTYTPGYAKLLSVDGNCRMIELPVAVRYTFSRQKSHRWFATAGVSSYLMQRENYSLDYLYPSTGFGATHHYTYTDKDQYWLAALQVSLGYSTNAGSLGNLRIEPYYSLPLKGMGHGRLPVSSLGIRVGLTVPQF